MKFIIKKKFLLTSIFLLSINQIIYIPKVNSETCHGYAVRNADKSYLVIDPEDYWRLKRDCEAGFPKPFKLKMPSFDFFNKEKRRVRKYEKQKYRESVDRLSPRQKQIRQQKLLEYQELVDKRRAERLERLERRRLETESIRSANSDYFNQLRGEENCRKTLYNQVCAGGEPCTVTLDSCPEKGSVYWLD